MNTSAGIPGLEAQVGRTARFLGHGSIRRRGTPTTLRTSTWPVARNVGLRAEHERRGTALVGGEPHPGKEASHPSGSRLAAQRAIVHLRPALCHGREHAERAHHFGMRMLASMNPAARRALVCAFSRGTRVSRSLRKASQHHDERPDRCHGAQHWMEQETDEQEGAGRVRRTGSEALFRRGSAAALTSRNRLPDASPILMMRRPICRR